MQELFDIHQIYSTIFTFSPSEKRSIQDKLADQRGFKLFVEGFSKEISELEIEVCFLALNCLAFKISKISISMDKIQLVKSLYLHFNTYDS